MAGRKADRSLKRLQLLPWSKGLIEEDVRPNRPLALPANMQQNWLPTSEWNALAHLAR